MKDRPQSVKGGFLQGLPVLSSLAFICYQGKSASAATTQLLASLSNCICLREDAFYNSTWYLAGLSASAIFYTGWMTLDSDLAGQHQNLVDQVGQSPLQTWVSAPSQATLSLAQGGHMHLLLGKVKSTKKVFPFSELWKVKVKVCQSNCGDCVSRDGRQSSAQMVNIQYNHS